MLVLGLLLSGLLPAAAQPYAVPKAPHFQPAPRFDAVGQGAIPRGVVAAIAQDRAGQLWLGTGDGVVRFDGYRFRPVERDSPDPSARNLGWVRAILLARDGRVWIGTESDGLVRHDPTDERITTYPVATGGPSPAILALAEDRDGAVWVGTGGAGAGLLRFDPSRASFTASRLSPESGGLPDPRVQALLVDRAGTLWVGTWQGLSRRVQGSDRFEPVLSGVGAGDLPSLAGNTVQALFEASDGRIWVGTKQGRLVVLDPITLKGQILGKAAARSADRRGAVVDFVEAPDGQIWVGRETGIDLHALDDGRLLRSLRHDVRKPGGLAANHVTSLLTDHAGAIWVGGLGGGLQRHDPNNRAIWLRDADPARPLEDADVRSLLVLGHGEVWAATHRGGVTVMDGGLNVIGGLRPPPAAAAGAALSLVNTMAQARDGSVWLGGDTMLHQFSPARRLLRSVPHGGGLTHHLVGGGDGSLWVGTRDGLYRLRPGEAAPVRVRLADGRPLPGDIFVMAEAADASLWVGSVKGLFRIAPGGSTLLPVEAEAGSDLRNPTVIGLLIDSAGTLWVDTAVSGLHRLATWDGRLARFDAVSARKGVVSRPFGVNLLEDRRGRIWSHLYVYDPAGDHLVELTAADGVSLGTGWFGSYAKTADGRLLFGGSKGLLVVEPERFDVSVYQPKLIATDLRINGRSRPVGTFRDGLQLAPGDRSFGLGFAALDYSDPGRVRYAYQLRGFDPEWIATGAELRVASYSNLDPGRYELRVRATNRSGQWSPHELVIGVQVLPAWWQTAWFWLAMVAALALMGYGVLQFSTRQSRLRQRELALRVQERTADLQAMTAALQQESAAVAEASLTDPLTGLRNRRFLAQHIDADIALALRRHDKSATPGATSTADADLIFFLIDIDQFKQVNDQLGHAAGDAVIRQMRDRLRQVFRDSDYLVRWGGEEFLIVARGTTRSHAAELAERARAAVGDRPFELDDGALLAKTCSVGFCCFPLSSAHPGALSWGDTVNLADSALYSVKRGGRNGWFGLLAARNSSPDGLRSNARWPLEEWHRSGELDTAASAAHAARAADGEQ